MIDKNKLEVERIENLITNFGWKVIKTEMPEKLIILTIQKDRIEPKIKVDVGAD